MTSTLEGGGGHGKADVVKRLHEFKSINHFQITTMGKGGKSSLNNCGCYLWMAPSDNSCLGFEKENIVTSPSFLPTSELQFGKLWY